MQSRGSLIFINIFLWPEWGLGNRTPIRDRELSVHFSTTRERDFNVKYRNKAQKTNSQLTSNVQTGKAAACCMAAKNAASSPRATARANSSFPRTMSPSKSVPANNTCSISPPSIPLSCLCSPSDLRVCPAGVLKCSTLLSPQPDATGRAPKCGAALFSFFPSSDSSAHLRGLTLLQLRSEVFGKESSCRRLLYWSVARQRDGSFIRTSACIYFCLICNVLLLPYCTLSNNILILNWNFLLMWHYHPYHPFVPLNKN